MTSRFERHTKRFIKAPLLDEPFLLEKQSSILNGKKPTNPLHLTLTVIHIAEETPHTDYLKSYAFTVDVQEIFRIHRLTIDNPRYTVMGTKPECLAVIMDTVSFAQLIIGFKSTLSLLLCKKLNLDYRECIIDEKYTYRVFYDNDGLEILKMAYDICATPVCHITLFTSFDLKRCNKELFKRYVDADDKVAFIIEEYGPIVMGPMLEFDPLLIT